MADVRSDVTLTKPVGQIWTSADQRAMAATPDVITVAVTSNVAVCGVLAANTDALGDAARTLAKTFPGVPVKWSMRSES
jgi:hypothetical protein